MGHLSDRGPLQCVSVDFVQAQGAVDGPCDQSAQEIKPASKINGNATSLLDPTAIELGPWTGANEAATAMQIARKLRGEIPQEARLRGQLALWIPQVPHWNEFEDSPGKLSS